jgi:predicted ATPase/transcriptional regulator with XRE-family HTH domain
VDGYPSFGYWVRRRRKALDLTQAELARRVFCALSTIKKIELDERRPSRQMAERLADCLHVTGLEREAFLAAAHAELVSDRLDQPSDPIFLKAAPSNLSSCQPLTPFVGCEDELAHISALIQRADCRLITLVGPGGIGKTRLAIQAASNQLDRYPDGVYFVPLAQLDSHAYIPTTILEALGLQVPPAQSPRSYLLDYLRRKAVFLVLDNFEHLFAGVDLLVDILRSAPAVTLLVTSREPLNLRMEHVFDVRGLEFPHDGSAPEIESCDALQLFIQTARRVFSGFTLSGENIVSMAKICKLVEGMPLAIELAASWVRMRTCTEIESQIESNLDILASTMLDVPERHRSIRTAFDFSWRLLSEEEKRVFSALSVFRGGFHLPAANEIADANEETLAFLVGKSLLRRAASSRYDMHELMRRYAEEKLNTSGAVHPLRDAHLSYYLRLAENLVSRSKEAGDGESRPFLEKEIDNFRASLEWALENRSQEAGLRLASALAPFWNENGYLQEGIYWLSRMLNLDDGRFPSARATALMQSGSLNRSLGDFKQAISLTREALHIFIALKDRRSIGLALMNLGIVSYLDGEFERGARLLGRSLALFREMGEEQPLVETLIRLADLRMRQDKLDEAAGLWQEGLLLSRKLANPLTVAFSLGGLGDIHRRQGKYKQAVGFHKESLEIHWEQNHKLDIPYSLEALALDFAALALHEQAALLWGAAESLRQHINAPVPPLYQGNYAPIIMEVRSGLGEADFERVWAEGRNSPLERIITIVLDLSM